MSVRIFRLVTKICVKNILRIFQAHFRENVKNTEPGRKFHRSYKKKRVSKKLFVIGKKNVPNFFEFDAKFVKNRQN